MEGPEKHILLVSGDYWSHTAYTLDQFKWTMGGSWVNESEDAIRITYEWHSTDSAKVGTTATWSYQFVDTELQLNSDRWKSLETGQTTPLTGPWLISGRMRDGEISRLDTERPRKTMKILTGNRFQWIAYDIGEKRFLASGGGTYTAERGRYIEKIKFFSRDNSRVGAQLLFTFRVDGNDWHHKGKSSKGEPLYEVWSKRD